MSCQVLCNSVESQAESHAEKSAEMLRGRFRAGELLPSFLGCRFVSVL